MHPPILLLGLIFIFLASLQVKADFSDVRSPVLKEAIESFQKSSDFPFQGEKFFPERQLQRIEVKALFKAAGKNVDLKTRPKTISKKDFFDLLKKSGISKKAFRVKQAKYPITRGEAVIALYLKGELSSATSKASLAVISCQLCVNGVDLSKYEWSKSPVVRIEDSKLFVGVFNLSYKIQQSGIQSSLLPWIQEEEKNHRIASVPKNIQSNVNLFFPDLYLRAVGIRGGVQDGNFYRQFENQYAKIFFLIKNADGTLLDQCPSCQFEEKIIEWYNAKNIYPPFENWIESEDAKLFIFEVIHRFGFADIDTTLKP